MELTLQIVVVATVLLIAMVVIIFIFSERTGGITKSLKDCQSKGGECKPKGDCLEGKQILIATCPKEVEVCCLKQ